MKLITGFIAVSAMALSLSACGYSRGDRALSGAGLGAAGGAVGAAILGADPLTGAIIGGAGGAAIGAATAPENNERRRYRDRDGYRD